MLEFRLTSIKFAFLAFCISLGAGAVSNFVLSDGENVSRAIPATK